MNEKILLVDDEESNLGLLTQWLVPLGYDLVYALNGEEAVRRTREDKPDLIILDIMMPVMNGYEACQILKNVEDQEHPDLYGDGMARSGRKNQRVIGRGQ